MRRSGSGNGKRRREYPERRFFHWPRINSTGTATVFELEAQAKAELQIENLTAESNGPIGQGDIAAKEPELLKLSSTGHFSGAEDVGWFIHGVAIFAAGQLHSSEALPDQVSDIWSGAERYARAGSLSANIDATHGRAKLSELIADTTIR